MAGVADVLPTAEQVARLRTDRTNRHLQPLLAFAKLILGNSNPDLGRSAQGNRNVYAVVWDMNVLFEEYVGHIARIALGRTGLAVDLQASVYLAKEMHGKRNVFLLTPDILVRSGRAPWAVIDTKWKILDPHEHNLGVSSSDIYQVLAYAHRYETDLAVLLYPHRGALGQAGIQKEFLIQGSRADSVCVQVCTVDLSSFESIAEQLERAFLPGWRERRVM